MKTLKTKMAGLALVAAVSATPLLASESFGGIGVTIYQTRDGVQIAEVIPGTPAADSKLQVGDVIIAVDGEMLAGKTIDYSKEKLRGLKNKPLEVTFVSGGETYSATLRRTQITVKDLEGDKVSAWYNNKAELNAQEIETYASAAENSKQLVAVLDNGSLVKSEKNVAKKSLNGIYVDRADEFAPKTVSQNLSKASSAELKGISRAAVSFELKSAGKAVVSVMNAVCVVISKLLSENAKPGFNSLKWNSENVPSGRYMVTIEHNGSVSGKNAVLK